MLKKHAYSLLFIGLSTASMSFANTPIESRGLSQNNNTKNGSNTTTLTPNINWEIMQKTQQLETDIRNLLGKIEVQENEIERLKSELNNRYTDLDQRLELLRQKVDGDETPEEEPTEKQEEPQDISPSSNDTSTPIAAKSTTSQPLPTQGPSELEKADYTKALDAYKLGGAKKAIQPMSQFIQNYPNSAYVSNAHFWLAEFNLASDPTDFTAAKKHFSIVSERYPHSAKASSATYRLYTIALNVDHNAAAAQRYKTQILNLYPKSEEARSFQ